MFVKKTNGYVIRNNRISTTKFLQALLVDWIADANVHFLNWVVVEDEKLCVQCKNMWGKVYERHNLVFPLPPLHPHCRCALQPIQTAKAGTATNEHLPEKPGRIWYEADINYSGGYRNSERILYSNDGLIFITLDHYRTFIEII